MFFVILFIVLNSLIILHFISETIIKSNNSTHKKYYNILNVTKMYL